MDLEQNVFGAIGTFEEDIQNYKDLIDDLSDLLMKLNGENEILYRIDNDASLGFDENGDQHFGVLVRFIANKETYNRILDDLKNKKFKCFSCYSN